MKKFHFKFRRFCAVLIGLVFFLAGVSKLADPVGAMLKVREYLNFFHMAFLRDAAMPLAVCLAMVEALSGVALITGVYRKAAAVVAGLMTVFFTIVTFILWVYNPEMDCGCFGEVVKLSHAGTLIKNIVLLLLCLVAFMPFREFGKQKTDKTVSFWLIAAGVVGFAVYPMMYRPLVDRTDFKPDSQLAVTGGDSFMDEGDVTMFIYEKGGERQSFSLDNLPDSTWTFVDTETLRTESAVSLPELALMDAEGNYADELAGDGKVMVFSVWDTSEFDGWERLAEAVQDASAAGFRPIVAMAGDVKEAPETISDYCYVSDFKTLVSLNRSNGGAVYFNDGTLIRKWARRTLPEKESFKELALKDPTDVMLGGSTPGRVATQAFLLVTIAIMALA